jgi:sarcosine oxidase subunit alpha
MSTTSSGASGIYEWMQWWLQSGWGAGVHLTNLTDVYSSINIAGPRAREVLKKLSPCNLDQDEFPYMSVRSADVAGVMSRIMRIGFTGELSYEVHCPSGNVLHVWESLMEAGEEFGIIPFGVETQRILRLQKIFIIVGQDTDALSDPISANMEWIVKMDKPDFLGKRSLTRILDEGKKQTLIGYKMEHSDSIPEEGSQIVINKPGNKKEIIGWITSSRFSPTLNEAIGLCWLPPDIGGKNGASFTIKMNGKLETAHVFHGAFYDPEGTRQKM